MRSYAILCVFSLLALFGVSTATAQTLATPGVCYATTGFNDGGRLLTINPTTGVGTLIGNIPANTRFGGVAINSTGEMFATNVANPSNLYRIDAATGAATLIGNTGVPFVDAIAFDASDVLFAAETFPPNRLYTINVTTATATLIGATGPTDLIAGLAFDPTDGVLYGSTGACCGSTPDRLYTINTTTGVASFVGATGLGRSTPDIFFDLAGNLFGSKGSGGGGSISNLISINKATGVGVVIGSTGFKAVSGLDCFFPPASIPTTSDWGLIILALLLLTFGVVVMMQQQGSVALANAKSISISGNQRMPFDSALFGKLLVGVSVVVAGGFFAAASLLGYELTSADIPGGLIASPILAYLIHLVVMAGRNKE